MKPKILFSETQRFTQWWVWVLIVLPLLIEVALYFSLPEADKPNIIWMVLTGIIVIGLFAVLKLETRITEDGIDFRFFPFHLKFNHYAWKNITEKQVRTYSPLTEYGGWGIRGFGKNKAFNVSGNQGLQLVFEDGSRRLLGTKKPEEIKDILKTIKSDN